MARCEIKIKLMVGIIGFFNTPPPKKTPKKSSGLTLEQARKRVQELNKKGTNNYFIKLEQNGKTWKIQKQKNGNS